MCWCIWKWHGFKLYLSSTHKRNPHFFSDNFMAICILLSQNVSRGEKVWSTLSGCWKTYKKKIRINNHPIDLTNNSCVEKNEEFAKSRSIPALGYPRRPPDVCRGRRSQREANQGKFLWGRNSFYQLTPLFLRRGLGGLGSTVLLENEEQFMITSGTHLRFFTHSKIHNFPPIGKRQALLRI